MKKINLYAPFKRLKNFPIDETTTFETYEDARVYVEEKENTTAYRGQVIGVYDDKTEERNLNGIYLVIKDSSKPTGLSLEKAINQDQIDGLNESLDQLRNDLAELDEKLGDDIDSKLESFASKEEVQAVNQRVEDLIGLAEGEDLVDKLDTIKEISDWINNNEALVNMINTLNTDLGLVKISIQDVNRVIIDTSNQVQELRSAVQALSNAGYITRTDAEALVKKSSYGYRELSINHLTYQEFNLPGDNDIVINKIHIYFNRPCSDAIFKIYFLDSDNEIREIYISNDNEDTGSSYIDVEESGHFEYTLGVKLHNRIKLCYEISYGNEHQSENDLDGYISVSYYTLY